MAIPDHKIITPETLASHIGKRLDAFLAGHLERSRNFVQALIKEGGVSVEPAPSKLNPSYKLREGDAVTLKEADLGDAPKVSLAPAGEALPLKIVFEDEYLLVVNKAPGIVVHPAAGHATGTLVNALVHHCRGHLATRGGGERLGIVHRLDKETSGLLVVAKTDVAHERLGKQFQERLIRKEYVAIARGLWRQAKVSCREPIARHPVHRKKMAVRAGGRSAHTDFILEQQWALGPSGLALVRCHLHTGRTHQIRVHLSHLGHPVLGDTLYGRAARMAGVEPPARQLLHAQILGFQHPVSGEALQMEAPLPEDFTTLLEKLEGGASA